jgi:protein-S-isoprenylcysteine O-methyltransferase Ste14
MKKRQPSSAPRPASLRLALVKGAKIAILLAVVAQTILGDPFPLSADPALFRAAGAFTYTAGLLLAIAGRLQLGDNWLDIETAGTKRKQAVVSTGVYRYLRHPIYVGDLLLLFGLELALNSWAVFLVLLLAPVVLRQAIREEGMLARSLSGYDDYCRRTKRFIPFVA